MAANDTENVLTIDEEIMRKYYTILEMYGDNIPNWIETCIEQSENGKKEEIVQAYANFYGMDEQEVKWYIVICAFKKVRDSIVSFNSVIETFDDEELEYIRSLVDIEISEISRRMDDILDLNKVQQQENRLSLVMFGPDIDDYWRRTFNARSGTETLAMKSVISIINKMETANYLSLRADVHQVIDQNSKSPARIADCTYERMGGAQLK